VEHGATVRPTGQLAADLHKRDGSAVVVRSNGAELIRKPRPSATPVYSRPCPGVGTGRQAGFRFLCPSDVWVRVPPWALHTDSVARPSPSRNLVRCQSRDGG